MNFVMNRARFWILIFLTVVVCGSDAHAREPQVIATLDKQSANVNEEVHLNIKISGAQGGIQAPSLPSLEGFEIFYSGRASRFSFVNGRSESLTEFNYVLIPRNEGRFVIQPIEVALDGKLYQTEQLEIEIMAARTLSRQSQPRYQPTPPLAQSPSGSGWTSPAAPSQRTPTGQTPAPIFEGSDDESIFLQVRPSKYNVYTNEQLILDYAIMTRYDTRYEGFEEEPETSGFWIEEFPLDYKNLGRQTETFQGRKFVRADIKKLALFPTAAGDYVIKPGKVKTSVQIQERSTSMFDQFFSDSFFSGSGLFSRRATKYLTASPIEIQVKELPTNGRPDSFKGAVGDFRMSTEVDKRTINQSEAVTLSIALEGQGNIETLSLPEITEPEHTKVYESDTRSELYRHQNVIAGSKTFEIIFIPNKEGQIRIPVVEFSFFNPRSERYVTLKSESYMIQVNPSKLPVATAPKGVGASSIELSKKGIQREEEDIYYIKEQLKDGPVDSAGPIVPWLGALDGLLTLLFLGVVGWKQRNLYLDQNISVKRGLQAKRLAHSGLKNLMRLSKKTKRDEDVRTFFDETARVLDQYLSDRLNLSAHGMTRNVLDEALRDRGIASDTVDKIRNCYDRCDEVRFGHFEQSGKVQQETLKWINDIVKTLERS